MSKKTPYTSNNASAAAKPKQAAATSKGKAVTKQDSSGASASSNEATTTKIIVHGKPSSTSDHLLFWLDASIDPKNEDCTRTIKQLQSVISNLHVFNNGMECANFLHTIRNQSVFLVVSGSLGQEILPRVHHMSQLTAVFIFCGDRSKYESLMKNYPKVRGIFTDITGVCKSLKEVFQRWDEESSDISLISASDASGQNIDHLDRSFMYTQLIKEIILEFKYDQKEFNKVFNEFVVYCHQEFSKESAQKSIIDKFEREYRKHAPIWWYSMESFLYHMLNKALREQKTDTLIKMGFFINDIHQQIEQLHREQKKKFSKKFLVYRGEGVPLERLKQIEKTKGGLLAFNNFLSTSSEEHIAYDFVNRALKNPANVGVLYTIIIDPSISSTPFASLDKVSDFGASEKEILFSMHTIFRISSVRQDNDDPRLWHVQLELTRDNDQQLNQLLKRMRLEVGGTSRSYRLGALMIKIGEFDKAREIYEQLLQDTPNVHDKANTYYQLGYISDQQGHYDQALHFYENALKLYLDRLSVDHPNIPSCYNNMGMVYDSKKEYKKALAYYQKALELYDKTSSNKEENVGTCYSSIGVAYSNLGDYEQALLYCKRAMEILTKFLPATHPSIATTHNNLGLVYSNMKKYPEAVASYKNAIEIGKNTLHEKHPVLEMYRKNLETVRHK